MYNCWLIKFLEKSLNNSSFSNICYFDRLATMVSIIVFSLSWRYGVLIATTSMCLIVFIIPTLATLYNGIQCCSHKTSLADHSILFIPVPSFQPTDADEIIQKSRMKNKGIVSILIVLMLSLQFLITQEVIPFIPPDMW